MRDWPYNQQYHKGHKPPDTTQDSLAILEYFG